MKQKQATITADKLMSVAEYAISKNISNQTVYNQIEAGTIEALKIGKITMIVVKK